jgi:hypothetical protein
MSSYRRRRRLAWLGGLLIAAGLAGVLIALLPSPEPRQSDVLEPGEVEVYKPPKAIRVSPRMRREVDATVDEFVRAAVLRRDPARSWELVAPELRVGSKRSQWMRGELPVFPYPADPERTAWELEYADEVEVALNVTLVARRGEREPPQVFGVSLEPERSGKARRWLVAAWFPRGAVSQPEPPAAAATTVEPAAPTPGESEALRRATEGQIDRIWWLVPAGILALIVLGPLGYFAAMRLRAALRRPPTAP